MTRVAAEVADAALLIWPTSSEIKRVRELLAAYALSAARPTPGIVEYLYTGTGDSGSEQVRALRATLAWYVSALGVVYQRMFVRYGFAAEVEAIRRAWSQGRHAEAASLVTDEMLDATALWGTADDTAGRVDALHALGVDEVVLRFPERIDASLVQDQITCLAPGGALPPARRCPLVMMSDDGRHRGGWENGELVIGDKVGGAEPMAMLLSAGDPGRPALIVADGGEVLTYAQLADQVEALALALAALGVRRGDTVALCLPNGPDIVLLLLAVMVMGGAAAPLNPAYTESEFGFYLGDIGPRLLLVPASGVAAATSAAARAGTMVVTVTPGAGGGPGLAGPGGPAVPAGSYERGGAEDVALVLHTSGTTSRPKQVPLRQRNVMASAVTIAAHYGLGPSDVSFCVMPLFHIHGLVASTFAALRSGGAVITPRRFTPHRFWAQARAHGATWLSAGPTLHQMILDRADEAGPPTGLRFARSCSSALSPTLAERAERVYRAPMLQAYGMTEASHQMSSNPLPPAARLAGSVGIPTGTDIAIVSGAGEFLPAGTAGEVVIRGPAVMSGYVHNPAATAEAFFGDWFRTGDRGVFRDGYLFLEGRIKEMIIRGGENISPAEIEEVLLSHPAVGDAVCFAVPDEKYGELVGAAVTVTADVEVADLTTYCRERLAAFKVPARIDVLEAIPRTATGKVQRRKVAEVVLGGPR